MKLVTFQLGDEMYGLPIENMQSIEIVPPIRRMPMSGKETLGVINLRGVVTAVKDLHVILGISSMEITEKSRLILSGHSAYLVDAAETILECGEEEIQPYDETEHQQIRGVVNKEGKLITLLNL